MMGKLKSQIQAEVERVQESRADTPGLATRVSLDDSGGWQGHDGELSDDDKQALDSMKPEIFGPELESLNRILAQPVPARPETGEDMQAFRDYAKKTKAAAAQRDRIHKALGTEQGTT
jgi:hypothetical protein